MGERKRIVEALAKLLKGWDTLALDSNGIFGGIITRWRSNIHLLNSLFLADGICTDFSFQELEQSIEVINCYGPYDEKNPFCNELFSQEFNFTLSSSEVWGQLQGLTNLHSILGIC
jgi:hypothetical protein